MNHRSHKIIQKRLWQFIYEFRDRVVKKFGQEIDFMIIYGSAVRGEFVPGKSDVDMVMQIFKEEQRKNVEKEATKIFWELARKYPELQFEQSLSISQSKQRTALTAILEKIEQASFLYVPIFVFVKGEIDWSKGELHSKNPLVTLGQQVLVPQRSIFLRFKDEGVILYGRDIRKEIKVRLTLWDRLRLGTAPQVLSFVGFLVSPLAGQKARRYAVKALLYQIDALLTELDHYQKLERTAKIEKTQQLLLQEFTDMLQKWAWLRLDYNKGLLRPRDFRLFTEALELKMGQKKLNHGQTVWFCFKAWWFIVRTNGRALVYVLLRLVR